MKKMLFYITNTLICAIFLNVRLAFLLFGDAEALKPRNEIMINILSAVFGTIMLISIILSYREARKK